MFGTAFGLAFYVFSMFFFMIAVSAKIPLAVYLRDWPSFGGGIALLSFIFGILAQKGLERAVKKHSKH